MNDNLKQVKQDIRKDISAYHQMLDNDNFIMLFKKMDVYPWYDEFLNDIRKDKKYGKLFYDKFSEIENENIKIGKLVKGNYERYKELSEIVKKMKIED